MINYLLTKITGLLALLAGFFGLFWWGRYQVSRRKEAEARAKVAGRLAETVQEQGERREKVDKMGGDELIDYLRR